MVEWDGLENRCTGNRTVGSNPTLSANLSNQRSQLSSDSAEGRAPLIAIGMLE